MHEYDGWDAQLYDGYSTGVPGDVDYFIEEARRAGGPVLELGCGTGRVTLALAQAGIEVVGLDRAPAMLARARDRLATLMPEVQRRVTLVQGDVCALGAALAAADLTVRAFPLVIFPFRGFQHLLDVDAQVRALTAVRAQLSSGGRFIVDLFDPRLETLTEAEGVKRLESEFVDPADRRVMLWLTRHFEREAQLLRQFFIFEVLDDEGQMMEKRYSTLTMRYFFRYEMQHLLQRTGFCIDHLWGDFERGPFVAGGEQLWVCSVAPPAPTEAG